MGYQAGEYISTGNLNTALGTNAMQGVSATPLTGNGNVAVGDSALQSLQGTATRNTAIGLPGAQHLAQRNHSAIKDLERRLCRAEHTNCRKSGMFDAHTWLKQNNVSKHPEV